MPKIFRFVSLLGFVLLCGSLATADFTSPAKNLSNSALPSMHPKIAGTDGSLNVFVVWMEYVSDTEQHLYFAKSTDGGTTWGAPVQLTFGGQIFYVDAPTSSFSICVNEPYVHIVYNWRSTDSDDWEISYYRSADLGETWDLPIYLTANASNSVSPDVAARGSYVHVTYQDNWPGNSEIFYKRLTDNGAGGVDLTRRLTFSDAPSYVPKIAVSSSGEDVHVVYLDLPGTYWQILYKHIYGSGAGSFETRQLTFSNSNNDAPDIAVSTGADPQYVYVVYVASWPGNREIIYKRLDNSGQMPFNTYTARLTYSTTYSESPAVEFDSLSNNVHICYFDDWPGNYDVMYRKLGTYGGGGFTGQRVSWGSGASYYPTVTSAGAWAHIAWMDSTSGNWEIYVKYGN
jgi:hypothetical protein